MRFFEFPSPLKSGILPSLGGPSWAYTSKDFEKARFFVVFIFYNLCGNLKILIGIRALGPARVAHGPPRIALLSIRFSLFHYAGQKHEKHEKIALLQRTRW